MAQYIARRFLWMLMVLFVISLITFLLMHSVPGGPFDGEKKIAANTLALLNKKYHLDDPITKQYLDYIGDIVVPRVLPGAKAIDTAEDYLVVIPVPAALFGPNEYIKWINLGPTFASRSRSVNDLIRDNLPVSMQLGVAALVISIAIGMPLGVLSALKRNTWYDYAGMGTAIIGVSVPVIISAPILQYFFSVQLRVLPVTGWGTVQNMILPAFALGFVNSAIIARLTRASLLQVMGEDYIRTARAKGLSERVVISIHALKNSLIPVVTILGPLFAALVTGTFVVETVFGIPGMGKYFVTSITGRDYPVIMGTILIFAFMLVVMNLFVDIGYAWLDPRIRFD
jgi:ABC-type dipeptide/oligopeptide/nickel transport system permease component